jgi:hypothetical protein
VLPVAFFITITTDPKQSDDPFLVLTVLRSFYSVTEVGPAVNEISDLRINNYLNCGTDSQNKV